MLWLLGCARPVDGAPPPDPAGWIGAHAGPLAEVTTLAAGRRVVALGESSHGTHEFFATKQQLIGMLADGDTSLVAMELPYAAGLVLNGWIHGEGDDPTPLLLHHYIYASTDEMRDLVRFLRERGDVELFGIDVAQADRSAQALADLDPVVREPIADLLDAAGAGALADVPDLEDATTRLDAAVAAARSDEAVNHLSVIAEYAKLLRYCERGENAGCWSVGRDEMMADNVARRLTQTGADQVVVWAHNGHVSHVSHPDGWTSAGQHLRDRLGADAVVSIALEFDQGELSTLAGGVGQVGDALRVGTRDLATYAVGPPPEGTLPAWFARARPGPWLLDLGPAREEAWASRPQRMHEYGLSAPTEPVALVDVVLADAYDAVLFVGSSTPLTFLEVP